MTHRFTAELWFHGEGPGSWCFVTLPVEVADEIRASTERLGFGSVRVEAVVGEVRWGTSVFPDSKSGSYVLPVKAAVRRALGIDEGDVVDLTITIAG